MKNQRDGDFFREAKVLSGFDYFVAHGWSWSELNDCSEGKISFGHIATEESMPIALLVSLESPEADLLSRVVPFCETIGLHERALWQFSQFDWAASSLFHGHDLSDDGIVSFSGSDPKSLYAEISSLFNCLIISGKRLIESVERTLKKRFSKEDYERWKEYASRFYDECLAYAFCYDFRNTVEHECAMVSIVNVDMKQERAGFAVNVDGDMLDYNIKASTRNRLMDFAVRRRENGESPWLSLGDVAGVFAVAVSTLYLLYVDMLIDRAKSQWEKCESYYRALPRGCNCLVREATHSPEAGYGPIARAYTLYNEHSLPGLDEELVRANRLIEECTSRVDAHDRLRSKRDGRREPRACGRAGGGVE